MAVIGWLQVINAALALAAKPNSKVAQDNMDLFKEQWEKQVRVLTDAVDDITSIDDFLSVSGKFLLVRLSPKSKFQVLLVLYLIFAKNFFMQSHFHDCSASEQCLECEAFLMRDAHIPLDLKYRIVITIARYGNADT